MIHFGKEFRDKKGGHRLTRDNYCIINNKSSFGNKVVYTDDWCQQHYEKCMVNFDKNIEFYSSLDKVNFADEMTRFLDENKEFTEVTNILDCNGVSGCYVMVLDHYCQVYVGVSSNIMRRIISHWSKTKEFDRLIFGGVDNSKLSIDSFRALDTTRLFISKYEDIFEIENTIVNKFNPLFVTNRISGGIVDGGLAEICFNQELAKPRNFTLHSEAKRQLMNHDTIIGKVWQAIRRYFIK